MTQHAILSAIGADRPGLVDEVSRYIYERGGNIEDSRMVNLRGQFAMMVLISAGDEAVRRLLADTPALASAAGLHVEVRPASSAGQAARSAAPTAVPYKLTATALDQAGLVHRIAHLLRSMEINIESLASRLEPAPYTGAPLFAMELIVSIPRTTALGQVRAGLAKLCDELNIDCDLSAV